MQKLGMKPFPGVVRVTLKKDQDVFFVIAKPEVFKHSTSDSYMVIGEAKVEDINTQSQLKAYEQLQKAQQQQQQQKQQAEVTTTTNKSSSKTTTDNTTSSTTSTTAKSSSSTDKSDTTDSSKSSSTDIDDRDIEIVMNQANVTREEAIAAITKNNKDIVNAIMELTM